MKREQTKTSSWQRLCNNINFLLGSLSIAGSSIDEQQQHREKKEQRGKKFSQQTKDDRLYGNEAG